MPAEPVPLARSVVPFGYGQAPRRPAEPLLRHVIGDVLRQERRDQARTLREVADTARISMAYLSEVERGRKEPSSEVLAAICSALGLTLVELVGRTEWQLSGATVVREDATLVELGGRPNPPGSGQVLALAG